MSTFVGREALLASMSGHLEKVRSTRKGVALALRGRRQVGKSTLVEEFLRRAKAPHAFFTATKHATAAEQVTDFAQEVSASSFQSASLFLGVQTDRWETAFRLLAESITEPSILVIDEMPYLFGQDAAFESRLQKAWDRLLSQVPILLIVVGSDLAMMELLGSYGRPLYQRLREIVVEPFNVHETATMLGLSAADAFDAQLVTGGFPRIAQEYKRGDSLAGFLRSQLSESTSPLVVVGERILNAEFPSELQAREVLSAIGSGETTFQRIGNKAGINEGSLARSLKTLIEDKRVVAINQPVSAKPFRTSLYYVEDSYLRFWLRFVGPHLDLILRGREDLVAAKVAAAWNQYRGLAVEPLIRKSLERLLPHHLLGDARYVGAFWNRTGQLQVDLVGAEKDRAPHPGFIHWLN